MRKEVVILGVIALAIIVGVVIGSGYYRNTVQKTSITNTNSNITPETLVRPDSPTLGSADAPVTLVEFLDPECESCASFSTVVKKIMKDYDGKIRLVVRYMPLHPNSMKAANLTEAAGEQGKYWQMQELLFQKQPEWGERHGAPPTAQPVNIEELFEKYAMELGLDLNKVNAAIKENKYKDKLERDRRDGQTLGVMKTPSFFVNGRILVRFSEADLRALIDDELKRVSK